MSIDLGTRSAAVVNGRCTGCGRFIKRTESHFHSPPRKFRGRPVAHLWIDGGGMVTRCDDVSVAQHLIISKYLRDSWGSSATEGDRTEAEHLFPLQGASVERGRVVPQDPETGYSWLWYPLRGDRQNLRGPGITTAVVWNP